MNGQLSYDVEQNNGDGTTTVFTSKPTDGGSRTTATTKDEDGNVVQTTTTDVARDGAKTTTSTSTTTKDTNGTRREHGSSTATEEPGSSTTTSESYVYDEAGNVVTHTTSTSSAGAQIIGWGDSSSGEGPRGLGDVAVSLPPLLGAIDDWGTLNNPRAIIAFAGRLAAWGAAGVRSAQGFGVLARASVAHGRLAVIVARTGTRVR